MANVSYPQYNLKTIILPVASDYPIEDYKKHFGIDLKDLFREIVKGKHNNTIFYIRNQEQGVERLIPACVIQNQNDDIFEILGEYYRIIEGVNTKQSIGIEYNLSDESLRFIVP